MRHPILRFLVYVLVMQRSLVLYHKISHESRVFSKYKHESVSNKWNVPWCTTRERGISIKYTVANIIDTTCTRHTTRRFDVIPSSTQ